MSKWLLYTEHSTSNYIFVFIQVKSSIRNAGLAKKGLCAFFFIANLSRDFASNRISHAYNPQFVHTKLRERVKKNRLRATGAQTMSDERTGSIR